jgi:spore coat polysaccharide biosynthesis protein SpsF
MSIQIFLQVRMGSTRLPGKAVKKIMGKTIVELIVERLRAVKSAEKIVLVTGPFKKNEALVKEAERLGIEYFCGSEENVLDRFCKAIQKFHPDIIVRITGDCPLVDPFLIEEGLGVYLQGEYDEVGNGRVRTYPDGLDYEIVRPAALERAREDLRKEYGSEQEFEQAFIPPTKYIMEKKKFRNKDMISKENLERVRLTLDYLEDFQAIEKIYEALYKEGSHFRFKEALSFLKEHPEVAKINEKHVLVDYGVRVEQ